jgi:hypothetical protein
MSTNTQTILALKLPDKPSYDDRIKEIVDIVVDKFDGDFMAFYESIRPKKPATNIEDERLAILADLMANRSWGS